MVWVLVVGDDATERMTLFRMVETSGHHATVVSVEGAVDLLAEDSFDVALVIGDGATFPGIRCVPVSSATSAAELRAILDCGG